MRALTLTQPWAGLKSARRWGPRTRKPPRVYHLTERGRAIAETAATTTRSER